MDDIVRLVSQKVGLSEDVATQAVKIVVAALQEKLPAPVSAQLTSLLASGTAGPGMQGGLDNLGDIANTVGGLMGNK